MSAPAHEKQPAQSATVSAPTTGLDTGAPDTVLTEQVIMRCARVIAERRLEIPAIFFLELNKPLCFLIGQSMLLASPLFAPLLGMDRVQRLAALLDDPGNVERLIQRIEELREEKTRGVGALETTPAENAQEPTTTTCRVDHGTC